MNNQNLYELTLLAEASYTKFDEYPISEQNNALKEKGFSETQATDILSNWSISSHQPDTSNGFSATLFKAKDAASPNQYVLALRGTEPLSIIKDWIATDFADICLDGLAMDQIVDLYNYWQQLNATENEPYRVAVLETDQALTTA